MVFRDKARELAKESKQRTKRLLPSSQERGVDGDEQYVGDDFAQCAFADR